MRAGNWSGLITNASPYALPPGAAVEQVNFHNSIPGQLTARGGMRKVAHVGDRMALADCCAVKSSDKTFLLGLASDGLYALESPAFGEENEPPLVPLPSADGGQVGTTYLWQYEGYGSAIFDPPDDEEESDPLIEFLSGGRSATPSYQFYINANAQCQGEGRVTELNGGRSSTVLRPPVLRQSQLCELP